MNYLHSIIVLLSLLFHPTFAQQPFAAVPSAVLTRRQVENVTLSPACNITCTNFHIIDNFCDQPHCGCNTKYVEAQGSCLLCYSLRAEDQALVQFLLDAEVDQCQREGFPVNFTLNLSNPAERLVQVYDRESSDLRRNQAAFLALQIAGGHIGLPVVLAFAVFSRRIRRDPTFLNFCITWIFSSVVFSLLLYHGTTDNTIVNSLGEVEPNICLAQAALTEGAQVMTACSTLSLIIRLWLGLRAVIRGDELCSPKRTVANWVNAGLLIVPYIFFVAFALASVFVGIGQIDVQGTSLQRVIPTYFYCTVVSPKAFIRSVYGITLVFLIITMGFDAHIISILYRHWWSFRHTKTKSAVSPSLLIRVVVFSIYRIVVAVADGTVLRIPPNVDSAGIGDSLSVNFSLPVWVDMLQAAIPLMGALVLGLTSDMVTSLAVFRRRGVSIYSLDSRFDADADADTDADTDCIDISISNAKQKEML